ncbi:MAG TPA: hypothetical protein VK463_14520 [Desulfomonilaceae bacterium]|nr:hypothetical protein [Desulfomonilaceae bacterium]
MRSAVTALLAGYAIIGMLFFATSLYLYLTGTENIKVWRFNNILIWLVVLIGLTMLAGTLLLTLTGTTL